MKALKSKVGLRPPPGLVPTPKIRPHLGVSFSKKSWFGVALRQGKQGQKGQRLARRCRIVGARPGGPVAGKWVVFMATCHWPSAV